jgi:ankyrin repeat protein
LIQAVFAGDINEVRSLIDQRVDINYQSPSTRLSALHVAAFCSGNVTSSSSNKSKLCLNLDAKGNADESGDVGEEDSSSSTTTTTTTAMPNNKYSNFIDIVNLLCKSGARVNSKDIKSLTPLHYACRSNGHETVQILLEHQADVNSRDKNWQAPIHICAMYNSVNCASLIIEHMLNIDVSDRQGRSALAHAAFNGNTEVK